ncbi:MAG: dihydrofolate reductase family protein [Solirubrobacterales bacterium]|nr:dihydrofolate reductase family protein [Solirubrobacterales bacterium]
MTKIVSNFFISLDGVVESPHEWHFPYFNDEMSAAMGDAMDKSALLMGRKLYEEWAAYWPNHTGEDADFADFLKHVDKYVVSNTLEEASWENTTIVSGDDIAKEIRDIKERTQGEIGMSGSATLVRWLLAEGLLDELNLLVHPIVVGHGQRLFEDTPTHRLELTGHEVFSTGVLNLTYTPAAD